MENSTTDIVRRFHFLEELENASVTIEAGLAVLQQGQPFTRNHFVVSLLLSVGLERFMKVLLALHAVGKTGEFPSKERFRQWGHNLALLRTDVATTCFDEIALARPAMVRDRAFLLHDPLVNELLGALNDFGMRDRYLHLEGLSTPDSGTAWLDERWDRIERLSADGGENVTRDEAVDAYLRRATQGVAICLERLLRALARTVTLSALNADARSLGTRVWPFLMRTDEQLGTTRYTFPG